jgi:hypothetical protein
VRTLHQLPYPAVVPRISGKPSSRIKWCEETLGQRKERWDIIITADNTISTFYFDDEKVAFEFILRFA